MFLSEFKVSTPSYEYKNFLSKIISENYDPFVLKNVDYNINDMTNIRNEIIDINGSLNKVSSLEDQNKILLKAKNDLVKYCNYTYKLFFNLDLKEKYSNIKILSKFADYFYYYDILTNKGYKDDIKYEFIYAVYNLAVVYFNLGVNLKYSIFQETNHSKESIIKEAKSNFEQSIKIFNYIISKQKEYNKSRIEINDLDTEVLNFKIQLCVCEAQSLAYYFCLDKKMELELQISALVREKENFDSLFKQINNERIFKNLNAKELSDIIKYYQNITLGLLYQKLSEKNLVEFKKSGLNYGYTVTLLMESESCFQSNRVLLVR